MFSSHIGKKIIQAYISKHSSIRENKLILLNITDDKNDTI